MIQGSMSCRNFVMNFFPEQNDKVQGGHDKGKAHQVGFCVASR